MWVVDWQILWEVLVDWDWENGCAEAIVAREVNDGSVGI